MGLGTSMNEPVPFLNSYINIAFTDCESSLMASKNVDYVGDRCFKRALF